MSATPVNLLALGGSDLCFWSAVLDNANAILYLDGGGVRGISELHILHIIMDRLKAKLGRRDDEPDPLPCEYFQLIGGTSTGGLIAIMLGRLRMTAIEASEQYNKLAKEIFGPQNKKSWVQDGTFKATTLQKAIERLVEEKAGDTGTKMIPAGNDTAPKAKWQVLCNLTGGEEHRDLTL